MTDEMFVGRVREIENSERKTKRREGVWRPEARHSLHGGSSQRPVGRRRRGRGGREEEGSLRRRMVSGLLQHLPLERSRCIFLVFTYFYFFSQSLCCLTAAAANTCKHTQLHEAVSKNTDILTTIRKSEVTHLRSKQAHVTGYEITNK